MNKAFQQVANTYKYAPTLTHKQAMMRFFRRVPCSNACFLILFATSFPQIVSALRTVNSWAQNREIFNEQATFMRTEFKQHMKHTEAAHRNADTYIQPYMPGGTLFMLNPTANKVVTSSRLRCMGLRYLHTGEPKSFQRRAEMGPVSGCTNPLSCAGKPHNYVDFDRVVEHVCGAARAMLPRATTHAFRVPPFGLVRLSRGGKTATAAAVFDRLKAQHIAHPIAITFNVHSGYQRRSQSDRTELLRLISAQLLQCNEADVKSIPTAGELDRHLGDKENIVLIVDEINHLHEGSIDPDAVMLLRNLFQDRPGRYLVFTADYPISLEPSHADASCGSRGIAMIDMSMASSLAELRAIGPDFATLTSDRAGWYAYVPSLVLTAGRDAGILDQMLQSVDIPQHKRRDLLGRFVDEILRGMQDPVVGKAFRGLQIMINTQDFAKVAYPLCYLVGIMEYLNLTSATAEILSILKKLHANLDSAGSDRTWEAAVRVAVLLRCMHAQSHRTKGPFNIAPQSSKPEVQVLKLPEDCTTVEGAGKLISQAADSCTGATLIHVTPTNPNFVEVSGFVVFVSGKETKHGKKALVKVLAYSVKDDAQLVELKPVNASVINSGAVVIRRKAPGVPRAVLPPGWMHMHEQDVRQLLGVSLGLALPRECI